MLIKRILPFAMASGLMAGAATAGAEISGNIALTTDYKFRGISQSDESPAIQGGFDDPFNFDTGQPAFFFGSVLRFTDEDLMMMLAIAPTP